MPRLSGFVRIAGIVLLAVAAGTGASCRRVSGNGMPVPPWTRGMVLGEPGDLPLPVPAGPGGTPLWMPVSLLPEAAFRDPPPAGPPAPGVVRVVLLGGAHQRAGVAAEAARRLAALAGAGRVEVLDLGLVLGNTFVAADLADRFLARWRPHWVVAGAGFEDLLFFGLRSHVQDRAPMGDEALDAPAMPAAAAGLLTGCGRPRFRPTGFFFEAGVTLPTVHDLWTLSRTAWRHGAGFAVMLDPLPDPGAMAEADRDDLRTGIRDLWPVLGDLSLYDARRREQADRVRAFAREAGVPLVEAAGGPFPFAGLGVPSPEAVASLGASLAQALGPAVRDLVQAGVPVPADRSVPAARPLAVPVGGIPADVPRDGTCVAGPCPEGTCLVPGHRATFGYDEAQRAAALAITRTFVGWADPDWFADDGPAVAVRVSPFCMDRTEVPSDVQARCVEAGACPFVRAPAEFPGTWPANAPAALDAEALCGFRGGRLPTDVEWEAAARGGDRRVFPWGDAWTGREANFLGSEHPRGPAVLPSDGHPGVAPIGAFDGRSPFGPVDLAGNRCEWVQDGFAMDAHDRVPPGSLDPVLSATPGSVRFLRGGGFLSIAGLLERRNARGEFDIHPGTRGVRCVFDFGTRLQPIPSPGR